MKLTVENIRTFRQSHTFNIRPLTIVVGENSAGKSTLLASLAIALAPDFPATPALFNVPPFELGSYDTIASYRGGKAGRSESFSIRLEIAGSKTSGTVAATFREISGSIRTSSILLEQDDLRLLITRSLDSLRVQFFQGNDIAVDKVRDIPITVDFSIARAMSLLQDTAFEVGADGQRGFGIDRNRVERIFKFGYQLNEMRPKVVALSPIRLKPRRTFDEFDDTFRPDGNHIPPKLAILEKQRTDKQSSEREKNRAADIFRALDKFGAEAGLFDSINVRRLGGQRPSDPFQVRVQQGGPKVNLADVGYGVSQSIPIVAETLIGPSDALYLVQQPEVHLHPRAQAALGTFFCESVSTSKRRFVIETHSDYLLDRVRREVANGSLAPSQVQLIYLDRPKFDSEPHHIGLDKEGNVTNPPACYRKFFLEEELALFARGV